ncbi:hypothetical protein TYRP_022022 [Tyrophagus putrescentiae]|nr:hypothetical protein TYRP_022022 [Tyrophagus putrescentiae]
MKLSFLMLYLIMPYEKVSKPNTVGENVPKALKGEVTGGVSKHYGGPMRHAIIDYPKANPANFVPVKDIAVDRMQSARIAKKQNNNVMHHSVGHQLFVLLPVLSVLAGALLIISSRPVKEYSEDHGKKCKGQTAEGGQCHRQIGHASKR